MEDNIDRILSGDQEVIPSPTFVRNVMATVRHVASTPASVPFPWLRVLPGLAIAAVGLIALLIIAITQFQTDVLATGPTPRVFVDLVRFAKGIGFGWIALAVFAAFAPTRLVFATRR